MPAIPVRGAAALVTTTGAVVVGVSALLLAGGGLSTAEAPTANPAPSATATRIVRSWPLPLATSAPSPAEPADTLATIEPAVSSAPTAPLAPPPAEVPVPEPDQTAQTPDTLIPLPPGWQVPTDPAEPPSGAQEAPAPADGSVQNPPGDDEEDDD